MAKEKVDNYTPDMVATIVGMYMGVRNESEARRMEVVKEAAAIFNKKERSIIAKLSRERDESGKPIYIPKQPVGKNGKPPVKKEDLVKDLNRAAGFSLTSAENLTKVDMEKLVAAFAARDQEIALLSQEISEQFGDFEPETITE